MSFPDFFDDVPKIELRDPLADFLGTATDGVVRYSYADAVRLVGHSCGVTASAWLMLRAGLAALYGSDLPERGAIAVEFRDASDHGTIGVTAAIVQLVTGAAGEGGFHGIGPKHRFARRDLMEFGTGIDGLFGLRRRDTGRGVILSGNQHAVPMPDELRNLFPRAVADELDKRMLARFSELWQDRVRSLLLDHADSIVTVMDWPQERPDP